MKKQLRNHVTMAICLLGLVFALGYSSAVYGQEPAAVKSEPGWHKIYNNDGSLKECWFVAGDELKQKGSRCDWYLITGGEYVFANDNSDLLIIHTIEPMTALKDQVIRTKKDLKFVADPKIKTLYLGLTEHNDLYNRVMTTIFSHRRVNIIKYPMDDWEDMLPAIVQVFSKVFGEKK